MLFRIDPFHYISFILIVSICKKNITNSPRGELLWAAKNHQSKDIFSEIKTIWSTTCWILTDERWWIDKTSLESANTNPLTPLTSETCNSTTVGWERGSKHLLLSSGTTWWCFKQKIIYIVKKYILKAPTIKAFLLIIICLLIVTLLSVIVHGGMITLYH